MKPKPVRLADLAESRQPRTLRSNSSLTSFFAVDGRHAELVAYLQRLRARGVTPTFDQIYADVRTAFPALPVQQDAFRRWLRRFVPSELLPAGPTNA